MRTGHSQAHNALGMDFFDYLEHNPVLAQEFSAGMSSGTSVWAPELADLIDTTNVRRAVDIGGANGALLALLQKANPALHGIVFDRPNIARDAKARTSLETASPNAPRSWAATSSSRSRPLTSIC